MLAPVDKLRSGGNNIIQVTITRKCDLHTCSNCTQLLPFRKDAAEMSLACIEKALVCLQGWTGVIACFGGNPCSHSQFEEVCRLWQKHVPERQRGLWTNNLLRHGAIVKETFWPHGTFNLNAHGSESAASVMREWLPGIPVWGAEGASHHGAMLLDYRDYGISEAKWVEARERCDINQNWSGAVYERDGEPHMYFCEVAGSLDGIRGENHGVKMEPGCWEWGMDKFMHQISGCCDRGCGVPLRRKGANDLEEIYVVSPTLVQLTENPVGKRTKVEVAEQLPPPVHELTDYESLRADAKTKKERLRAAKSPTRRKRK